ncbi:hypothetical protein Ancab_019355 [Ancistrocladus abbreviatus]
MEMEKQAYWWWFDSHNSPRRSSWLQSTLAELDQKTKAMLRLIEEDADSFAQRAEMYYKKRPELISMVEDFYRAHRSLADRFDQLRNDHGTRIASPLAHSLSFPRGQVQKVASNLCKKFDSCNVEGYDSEDSGELSEVDDPVQEETNLVGKDVVEELSFPPAVVNEEMTKLRKEIDTLKEENKIQSHIIQSEERSKEELKMQLSDSRNELLKLRGEIERLQKDKTPIMMQQNDEKCDEMIDLREENNIQKQIIQREEKAKEELKMQLSDSRNELLKLMEEIERLQKEKTLITTQHDDEKCDEMTKLREENKIQKQLIQREEKAKEELKMQLSDSRSEQLKLREEIERLQKVKMLTMMQQNNEKCDEMTKLRKENEIQRQLTQREEKAKEELKMQLSGSRNEQLKLREEIERLQKDKTLIMMQQSDEKCDEMTKLREENKIQKRLMQREEKAKEELKIQLLGSKSELQNLREDMDRLQKEKTLIMMQHENEKCNEMAKLRQEIEKLKLENRTQREQLMQKDEEKREVIRQLCLAMEMLREETLLLKKSNGKETPKKRNNNPFEFYRLKGLGKLFGDVTVESGFGGLGVDGMVGSEEEDPAGGSVEPAGVGKRGVMSGGDASGGYGISAGEADMAESLKFGFNESEKDWHWHASSVRKDERRKRVFEEAI